MIYLDNAATTMLKPDCVVEAVAQALTQMGNASRGAHGDSLAASRVDLICRERLAQLFACTRADHVCFTANSTMALNIALSGLANEGNHIISTDLEHNSVLRPLYRLQAERQVILDFVPADSEGTLDYDAFDRLLKPQTRIVVVNHASNVTGNLTDIERIGRWCKEHGLLFIVDASQTAGCIDIDMQKSNIDVLCFTGHKSLLGPQGTGGLCVREGVEIRPWCVGGTGVQSYLPTQPMDYPTRLEAGTLNSHGIAGLNAALEYISQRGVSSIYEHEEKLMADFYTRVRDIAGIKVYGDIVHEDGRQRCAVVSLNVRDYDSSAVSDELSTVYNIATRPGAHCAPRMHQALGTSDQGTVRFSFGLFNTLEDVDAAVEALEKIAS